MISPPITISPSIPVNESARLDALASYDILDTLPEETYEYITRTACELCGTPTAFIALIDLNREWIKAKQGLELEEIPRQFSFSAHAILNPTEVMVVPDARHDERFFDNPLTAHEPPIIFFAGVPLVDTDGFPLGALAITDTRPRQISDEKLLTLKALGSLICVHFELKRTKIQLDLCQGQRYASVVLKSC